MQPSRGEPSKAVTMAELAANAEPPAGPTVMGQAHQNGLRRAVALIKNRFKDPDRAEQGVTSALVVYLRTWEETYQRGVAETPSTVDRTILDIRRDTVRQILTELG